MLERQYTITNNQGLHARPASLLVQMASQSKSSVTLIKEGKEYNAKSVLGIMSVGAQKGDVISIRIDGPDEAETDTKIQALFKTNFGE
ncbi:Phosphotransferase system, HPr histidine phosphorylation site [Acididesulfobacillus acetoxydans]|uniref:Phosphocarrier protein HPr n=1 Tax=Acididesulfobacillus acetoxydans TaxID=1561005 RepID=A0A8S0XAM3_9FIRM|nr:HPr family phosphocarrier protein [Acididesulfobacillus acetoxydans]CAA7600106.1 Phosphotransferase system, HPr histidine phosphorylation site [Acididesulfobacillus acetoxydans]CEJ07650.1 Phosphocarrier protein signature [Acididesulfobacillus acetoxydans]